MKSIYISFAFLFICAPFLQAQEKDEGSAFKNYSSSIFDKKATALSVLSSTNLTQKDQNSYSNGINSSVLIQQIGNFNATSVTVNSEKSTISVQQNGNRNEYSLVKDAKAIAIDVTQNGNSNKIDDYSYRTNYQVKNQMIQEGNNQNIKVIGTNSISKDMKVTQTGNGASVIILNKLN